MNHLSIAPFFGIFGALSVGLLIYLGIKWWNAGLTVWQWIIFVIAFLIFFVVISPIALKLMGG